MMYWYVARVHRSPHLPAGTESAALPQCVDVDSLTPHADRSVHVMRMHVARFSFVRSAVAVLHV